MKYLIFVSILFQNVLLSAQNITFIYELKTNKIKPEYYYLDVLGKQSVFRSEDAREADSLMIRSGYWQRQRPTFNHLYSFKNLISNKVYKSVTHPAMYDLYYIDIDNNLDWKILPEKKMFGEMECQKATTNYGGRSWTAWFDPKNPIQDGPYIFYGLPGFIVRLEDDKGDYTFDLIKVKRSDKNNMFYLRKGKQISWEDYKKMQNSYYSDPFAQLKAKSMKMKVGDINGNAIDMSFKEMAENIQKQIRENNNPIELNQKVEFK